MNALEKGWLESRPAGEPMWGSETCVMEKRDTQKRLRGMATARGLGASGPSESEVDVVSDSE